MPAPAERGRDYQALLDIVAVQCHGDEDRALDLIEQIIRAPLNADSLSERWAQFWFWTIEGEPRRTSIAFDARSRRRILAAIALNAARSAA